VSLTIRDNPRFVSLTIRDNPRFVSLTIRANPRFVDPGDPRQSASLFYNPPPCAT
jgi:hypothetical protein